MLDNRENSPRVLCVDDQPELLTMLEHILSAQGFSVAGVTSGTAAIKVAEEQSFDAVVLDFEMPGMNGEEVALRLKEMSPHLPIVFFSAAGNDLPESVRNLADASISKGNSLSELTEALRRLTGSAERRKQPRRALDVAIEIAALDGVTPILRTRLANLSAGGFGVAEALTIAPGQIVALEITLGGRLTPLRATAVVRYKAGNRTGLEFVEIEEQWRRDIEVFCSGSAEATSASG